MKSSLSFMLPTSMVSLNFFIEFRVERNYYPTNLIHAVPHPFAHDLLNFQFTFGKRLSADEIKDGCMV
jgi:hypothetical protein